MVADAPVPDGATAVDMAIDESCADSDADGVCNTLDTWPCGAQPADLPATVVNDEIQNGDHLTITLTEVTVDNSRAAVVTAGASMQFRAKYSIIDCICVNCTDQIEVGFAPGNRAGCIYSGNPQGSSPGTACLTPTTGTTTLITSAPTQPGAYTMRFRVGQGLDCGDQTTWWANEPPPASTDSVHVCVQ